MAVDTVVFPSTTIAKIKTSDVRLVKELYPRITEDNSAIERYRAAIGLLPPIIIARDGILVDGYHRWQAHIKEGVTEIDAVHLGNLSDIEILKESMLRNANHGVQLSTKDKQKDAARLYTLLSGTPAERYVEISTLLSITLGTSQKYCKDARQSELEQQKADAWDMWLNCYSQTQISKEVGVDDTTVKNWIGKFQNEFQNSPPPDSRQHFDIWQFTKANGDSTYFGQMPPQVAENLLWFYTEPGQTIVDPFAGGGTTIKVAKEMGRRVWSSDIAPSTEFLPIHKHNILDGWPIDAPKQVDLILLDPPYWKQAEGEYGDSPQNLANMSLDAFYAAWADIVKTCSKHITPKGRIAYIISPTFNKDDGSVIDHAMNMLPACWKAGLAIERRINIPYSTQQTNGAQVEWAREKHFMLARYRDLVVLTKSGG
jgi:hypothetical protein